MSIWRSLGQGPAVFASSTAEHGGEPDDLQLDIARSALTGRVRLWVSDLDWPDEGRVDWELYLSRDNARRLAELLTQAIAG